MINPEIINERLEEINGNIRLLEELKSIPKSKFCKDPRIFKLAERCLQISIQAIIDISHHIIIGNNLARPKDNKEAIQIIARHKIINQKFAKAIMPMIGLRNILVHEYLKVDPKLIYGHLQHLKDFRQFQKYILAYLKKVK